MSPDRAIPRAHHNQPPTATMAAIPMMTIRTGESTGTAYESSSTLSSAARRDEDMSRKERFAQPELRVTD
jgi:hypothetical protein